MTAQPPLRGGLLNGLTALLVLGAGAALAQTAPSPEEPQPEIRAQLSPTRSTVLSAEIPGKIGDLSVREGERFAEGQPLVTLDCTMHKARLDKALALQQGARKTHQVQGRLAKLGSNSTLEFETSAAELAAAEAEVAMMRTVVSRCAIAAPFPGRVVELKVKRHQYVGEGSELLEILDDRELQVELVVPSRWLTWLKPGSAFTLALDETGKDYPAKVDRLAARIDPVSQTVKLFGSVTGSFPELMSGMSGNARFDIPAHGG
ncbi:efflux RND transporter periplasmic adaptor subunit [Azospirillum sp. SYSU D00513]|uniref:efflux RND transporter periplasmic adaptor subunit n=1 Tax=Azospirillum sp. SYSU D00513 TaxID=2812561 RepID=UPI001A957582|nr:efflux RND transporter periplasmic adaptor subunit [Azospirillum sp. SYSU D00513]